jgi:hypothetical protein
MKRHFAFLLLLALGQAQAANQAPVILSAGRVKLQIDPARGGVPSALWFDLNGDGTFSDDEKMLDTGPDQGLVLEVLEAPRRLVSLPVPVSEAAERQPSPLESWYEGQVLRLAAVTDSVTVESPSKAVVRGRFFWAGAWPYRLEWEVAEPGIVRGLFQLLADHSGGRPSQIVALGLDLRFHYRSPASFRWRTARAAVDKRIWDLPAEVVRWWSGRVSYDARPQEYGYLRESEIPWPDFNLVTLAQNAPHDCRLWKATSREYGNLTHWRGEKARGWMHVEDREWGLGYGIDDMARNSPSALEANLDTGDLAGAVKLRFWPRQAHRLDPRAADAARLTAVHRFFLYPNAGRWEDARAQALDKLGIPSEGITEVEPDANAVRFSKPADLPPASHREVVFRIDEPAGVERKRFPVTIGVPLRRGEVKAGEELQMAGADGEPVPLQTESLAYWPDHSIKWILLDAQVDLPKNQGGIFSLKKGPSPSPGATRVRAWETSTGVRVETGPLAFEIDRNGSGFVDRAWLDMNGDGRFDDAEAVVAKSSERRSILDYVRSDEYPTGDYDIGGTRDESRARVTDLRVERAGPLRAVVLIRGEYVNRVSSPFTLRLEAFAGKPWIRVQHTFTFTMDAQREFLTAMGLRLQLKMPGPSRAVFGGSDAPVVLGKDLQIGEALQAGLNSGEIWGAPTSALPAQSLQRSLRLPGWADVSNGRWGLTVAVQNFWQEYAKGISLDTQQNEVTAWFWAPEAPPLDLRRYSPWTHLQVGECCYSHGFPSDLRAVGNATGLTKTSLAVFAFHTSPLQAADASELSRSFQMRPVAICNPAYYGGLGMAGFFAPINEEAYPELERTLTDIADWFLFNRQRFSWYGLVDYGDIGHMSRPAFQYDPGQPFQFRDGWAYDIGRWGWTNTEGQDALGYFMTFFHTGYRPYFDAGGIAAVHNRDIDIFHWGPYKWHGHTRHNVNHWGDGDFEIRISQPSPTRFEYYLTGDSRSRDVIEGVVDELYTKYRLTQTADLGAVLYGFLVRWEMTGEPVWRDRALAVARAYGEYMAPDGALPDEHFDIDAATGRRLTEPGQVDPGEGLFFLHGFGAIHALIELEELTGDKALAELLHKHAVWCSNVRPGPDPFWLLLSYELEKTGEKRFRDRLLANIALTHLDRGLYPRDREKWTGSWGYGVRERRRIRGTVNGVHDIYTSEVGFSWNPIPTLIRALVQRGVSEGEVSGRDSGERHGDNAK